MISLNFCKITCYLLWNPVNALGVYPGNCFAFWDLDRQQYWQFDSLSLVSLCHTCTCRIERQETKKKILLYLMKQHTTEIVKSLQITSASKLTVPWRNEAAQWEHNQDSSENNHILSAWVCAILPHNSLLEPKRADYLKREKTGN